LLFIPASKIRDLYNVALSLMYTWLTDCQHHYWCKVEVRSTNSNTWLTSALSYITPDRLRVLSMEPCFNVNISSTFVQVLIISGSFNKTVIRKAGYITQLNNWKSEHLKRFLLIHSLSGVPLTWTYVVILSIMACYILKPWLLSSENQIQIC
jgi:hypothetical protein